MRKLPHLMVSAFLFCVLMSGAALADTVKAASPETGSVDVSGAWARPSVTKNGAVYLTLTNKGETEDALVAVASSVADKVVIHEMAMDGTIMRMRMLKRLVLPVGEPVTAAPGGTHIMLIGLKAPLKAGTAITLRLTFEKAGDAEISVPVQAQP